MIRPAPVISPEPILYFNWAYGERANPCGLRVQFNHISIVQHMVAPNHLAVMNSLTPNPGCLQVQHEILALWRQTR